MLVCKVCGCDVKDYYIGLVNIIPCKLCRDKIVVCRECANDWVVNKDCLCVCCDRDKKIGEVLNDEV